MPRKARAIHQGEYYHILSRGNNKQALFYDASDFEYYLRTLLHYLHKYDVSLYHYCLMTNHLHLLMKSESQDAAISRLMHGVQMVYARYFKKRNRATGHVFEDRFKHFLIESDSYLLECGRYIERNPVRARMVRRSQGLPLVKLLILCLRRCEQTDYTQPAL